MDLREIVEFALVMVMHNLALVARLTENIVVLNRGRIVEAGPTHRVLGRPQHPYRSVGRGGFGSQPREWGRA